MALNAFGTLTTSGTYKLTGATFDFEAFKASIHNKIMAYPDLIGEFTLDIVHNEHPQSPAMNELWAVLTFTNMIDACHFAPILCDDQPIPDVCALYLPVADSGSLFF